MGHAGFVAACTDTMHTINFHVICADGPGTLKLSNQVTYQLAKAVRSSPRIGCPVLGESVHSRGCYRHLHDIRQ